jgi:hypothetical protein
MQRKNWTNGTNGPPTPRITLKHRSNQELVAGARSLVGRGQSITAHLVLHLAEIYARKLHVVEGYSYLGDYCMAVLGMSEDEAKRRAHVAMLAATYPIIVDMLLEGSIHLTTVRIIGKCLTPKNHRQVLHAARGKSNRELEHLAAVLDPKPDVPTVLRKLPEPRPESALPAERTMFGEGKGDVQVALSKDGVLGGQAGTMAAATGLGKEAILGSHPNGDHLERIANGEQTVPSGLEVRLDGVRVQVVPQSRRCRLSPLSAERYDLHLTINKDTHDALRELQDLLRHQVPNGDLVTIVQDSILERRDRVKREKFGHGKRPRKVREQESWLEEEKTAAGVNAGAGNAASRMAGVRMTEVMTAEMQTKEVEAPEVQVPELQVPDMKAPAPSAPVRLQPNSRHIPVAVKREVWERDKGQCAFVSRNGRRCSEKGRLEFHHVHAYALGGPATVENIALRCRTHNAYEGVALFGEKNTVRPRANPDSRRPGALGSPAP